MRTYVRVGRRSEHPACRPGRVLRVGRAAGRSTPARPAGDRRGRGGARLQLRGEGLRRPDRDERRPGAPPVPAGHRRRSPACRRTPRPARPSSRSSRTPRHWSRGCRSTRRSSTSAACARSPVRRSTSPGDFGSEVLAQVGLPITVGVARTKFLAKVASGVAKPDGLLVVPPDRELEFLHPLAVERLWGVGEVTAEKLRNRGLTTVGDVAILPEAALIAMLGRASGRHLHALAHNRDPRPIEVGRRRRSIGSQRALGRRFPKSTETLDAVLAGLVDRVTRRMRSAGRAGRTVTLRLRFDDFSRATRSHTLPQATGQTRAILITARVAAGGGPADDREAGHHHGRDLGRQPGERVDRPAGAAVRQGRATTNSTPPSTTSATGSAPTPSPAATSSAATRV